MPKHKKSAAVTPAPLSVGEGQLISSASQSGISQAKNSARLTSSKSFFVTMRSEGPLLKERPANTFPTKLVRKD